MKQINQITITIWIHPKSLPLMIQHLTILEDAPLENTYTFQVRDIEFSTELRTGFLTINVPIELWSKFYSKYLSLKLKV